MADSPSAPLFSTEALGSAARPTSALPPKADAALLGEVAALTDASWRQLAATNCRALAISGRAKKVAT